VGGGGCSEQVVHILKLRFHIPQPTTLAYRCFKF